MTLETAAPRSPARTIPWSLFAAVLAANTAVLAYSFGQWGADSEGWLHAARYTARLSFLIFLAPFLASSLVYWFPSPATRWMRAKRRYLGLSFAFAHFIHLGALIGYSILAGQTPNIITLLGGGGAYVMIALMALTSNDWSVRTLGPKAWGWLHWLGLYDIWFVFTFSYFGRVTKEAPQEPRIIYITLFGLAVAALLMRIVTRFARRRAHA
jgi:DMSO/TMAO reductase YedYZ heme-binding membrane subunit